MRREDRGAGGNRGFRLPVPPSAARQFTFGPVSGLTRGNRGFPAGAAFPCPGAQWRWRRRNAFTVAGAVPGLGLEGSAPASRFTPLRGRGEPEGSSLWRHSTRQRWRVSTEAADGCRAGMLRPCCNCLNNRHYFQCRAAGLGPAGHREGVIHPGYWLDWIQGLPWQSGSETGPPTRHNVDGFPFCDKSQGLANR